MLCTEPMKSEIRLSVIVPLFNERYDLVIPREYFDSDLLAQGSKLHERLFGFRPEVKAIHAGLECGILKSKKPDCDILSFGPTIRGAHSPTERLEIGTVAPFWDYLKAMLAEL